MSHRKLLILVVQAALLVATYYCAFLLRFDLNLDQSARLFFWKTVGTVVILKLGFFYAFGLLRGWWRYVGLSDLLDISKASIFSFAILLAILHFGRWPLGFPRSVMLLDLVLTILATGGARCAVRAYTDGVQHYAAQRNTLIVGAGEAGSVIVRELQRNPRLDYKPVGFLDDNPSKKGIRIHGVKVLGSTNLLSSLIVPGRQRMSCVFNYVQPVLLGNAMQGCQVARLARDVHRHDGPSAGRYLPLNPMLGSRKLFDVIAAAGGTTPKAGNQVIITHRDQGLPSQTLTLAGNSSDSTGNNPDVFPGDTVVIQKAGVVYVVGDVRMPGGFIMDKPELTVLQALAMAQGANPTAKLDGARLIRRSGDQRQEVPIELKKILSSKAPDVSLQADDILFVPNSAAKSVMRHGLEAIVQAATGVAIYHP